jgi:hypothetical protein
MTASDSVLSQGWLHREAALLSTEQRKPLSKARGEIPDGVAIIVGIGL